MTVGCLLHEGGRKGQDEAILLWDKLGPHRHIESGLSMSTTGSEAEFRVNRTGQDRTG